MTDTPKQMVKAVPPKKIATPTNEQIMNRPNEPLHLAKHELSGQ